MRKRDLTGSLYHNRAGATIPANYSSKRITDAERMARWQEMPEAHVEALKIPRAAIGRLQAALTGHVVVKGEAAYDGARQIFNPLFDRYILP